MDKILISEIKAETINF